MKINLHLAICFAAIGLVVSCNQVRAQNDPAFAPYAEMMSAHSFEAINHVRGEQNVIQGRAGATFEELRKHPVGDPHEFEGPFHSTILLMGELNMKGAEYYLSDMLGFELDPSTVKGPERPLGFQFYPAAQTYAKVADARQVRYLFRDLKSLQTEKMLTIYGWILGEVHGQKLALLQIQSELANETAELEKSGKQSSDYKANLQRLEELLKTRNQSYMILVPPKKTDLTPKK